MTATHLQRYISATMSTITPYIRRSCNRQKNTLKVVRQIARRSYSNHPIANDGRPFRMAVIGSGPAGFYTAYKVLSKIDNATVDMYEQLPVPYGLVRFGVAPDHPEVKVCWRHSSHSFLPTISSLKALSHDHLSSIMGLLYGY